MKKEQRSSIRKETSTHRLFRLHVPKIQIWQMPLNVNIPHRWEDDRMDTMRDCLA